MSGQILKLMALAHELDSITTPIRMYQPLCQDFIKDLDQARYMIKRMLETIHKQETMDDDFSLYQSETNNARMEMEALL